MTIRTSSTLPHDARSPAFKLTSRLEAAAKWAATHWFDALCSFGLFAVWALSIWLFLHPRTAPAVDAYPLQIPTDGFGLVGDSSVDATDAGTTSTLVLWGEDRGTSATISTDGAGDILINGQVVPGPDPVGFGVVDVPAGTDAAATISNDTLTFLAGTGISITGASGNQVTIANTATTSFANPTATVNGTVVNGVATTAMRSDAAPAFANPFTPSGGEQNVTGAWDITGSYFQSNQRIITTNVPNSASANQFFGRNAGNTTLSGTQNTAVGNQAGEFLTSGNRNSFVGYQAGSNSSTGSDRVAIGYLAGRLNSGETVSVGSNAGMNGAGAGSIAIGFQALQTAGSGSGTDLIAIGRNSMRSSLAIGSRSVAVGANSLDGAGGHLGANDAVAIGHNALGYGIGGHDRNTAVGAYTQSTTANLTGSNNSLLGFGADTGAAASTFRTVIGSGAIGTADNQVTLGRSADTVNIPGDLSVADDTTLGGDLTLSAVAPGTAVSLLGVTAGNLVVTTTASGSGDVVGPASATDEAITRFDTTTGKLIQNSTATLSDGGVIAASGLVVPYAQATTASGFDIKDSAGVTKATIGSSTGTLQLQGLAAGTAINVLGIDSDNNVVLTTGGGGSGDVVGPASSTDNAIVRFDGTTGKLIQDSGPTINDDGGAVFGASAGNSVLVSATSSGNASDVLRVQQASGQSASVNAFFVANSSAGNMFAIDFNGNAVSVGSITANDGVSGLGGSGFGVFASSFGAPSLVAQHSDGANVSPTVQVLSGGQPNTSLAIDVLDDSSVTTFSVDFNGDVNANSVTTVGDISAGGVVTAALQPGCDIYNSAAQSLANNTAVTILFDTEVRDIGNTHSTSTDTGRMVAPVSGVYYVSGVVGWDSNGTGFREIWIAKNGATTTGDRRYGYQRVVATAAGGMRLTASASIYLDAGDYVVIIGVQNSGGALNSGGATVAASNSATFQLIN